MHTISDKPSRTRTSRSARPTASPASAPATYKRRPAHAFRQVFRRGLHCSGLPETREAFTGVEVLERVTAELECGGYRTHEFGDSVLIERRYHGGEKAGYRPKELPATKRPRTGRRACPLLLGDLYFEAFGRFETFPKYVDRRGGEAQLFRIRPVAGHLGIDELHPKQLTVNEFEKFLQLFKGQLNRQFLHLGPFYHVPTPGERTSVR